MAEKRKKTGRRTKAQLIALKQDIWDHAAQGLNGQQIANSLGITKQYVSKLLRSMADDVLTEMYEHVEAEKFAQFARLMYIYQESVQAWEASKKAKKRVQRRTVSYTAEDERGQEIPAGATREHHTITTAEDQFGDPRFLREARETLSDIRDLFGITPTRHEVEWREALVRAGVNPNEVFDLTVLRIQQRISERDNKQFGDYDLMNDPNISFSPTQSSEEEDTIDVKWKPTAGTNHRDGEEQE